METQRHNRIAWDKQVEWGNPWTIPVSADQTAAARAGQWEIFLTPRKPVPRHWFPPLQECNVLCLASGGGQQGPILAAAGADVTVLDNSPKQLAQDQMVAQRDQLQIATVEGDMADLSMFSDASFDLIIHPVSVVFVPDVRSVWREAFRVLRPGACLLSGFGNPAKFMFDIRKQEREEVLELKYSLPYSEANLFSEAEKTNLIREGGPLHFSHTLEDLIGGQVGAGFSICGFYEDIAGEEGLLSQYMPVFIVARAWKPSDRLHRNGTQSPVGDVPTAAPEE